MLKRLLLILVLAPGVLHAAPVIMVLGDSLSAGYGIEQSAGWVALLEERLAREGYDHEVVNVSISGETTRGGLARLEPALDRHRPQIVIVELGANDGLRGLPVTAMEHNLGEIVDRTLAHGAEVLLAGMRLPPNYGPEYTREFRQVYQNVAQRRGVRLVPFLLDGVAQSRTNFQADGLHPNEEAQPVILDNIWAGLRPLLE